MPAGDHTKIETILEKMTPHNPLNEDLIQLIEKHQRNSPLCKWIAGQLLHPCWQLDSPFAEDEGPVVDDDPALTGGIKILLCVSLCPSRRL
jgi:hypothetical protein